MTKSIKDIDWKKWSPKIRATLLFIFKENEILLIHKKTGLGKGKINAPGGKIEEGESPYDCAIRETFEEVCVQPSNVKKAGELFFQFVDGLTIHGYVFYTDQYLGWNHIFKRLISEKVEYEESGWYDGQVWEKPLVLREKEILIASIEVKPILRNLIQILSIISILALSGILIFQYKIF